MNNTPNRVTTEEQLRSLYGDPSSLSQQKFMDTLDEHCRRIVGLSPFVCIATIAEDGSLDQAVVDDIGWARYPRVFADQPSQPPLGGANLAVGAYSAYPDEAVAAIECINAEPKATQYMIDEGEPSPYAASYDNPDVRAEYDNADLIRESIAEAGPRPLTPFYTDVSGAVTQSWHPPASVTAETPERTDQFMADVLAGRRLL